ncbi:MAG TPA: hypothetical protein VGI95_04890 [Caulobacteraceae bacterium]|jgi:hypothetical protein
MGTFKTFLAGAFLGAGVFSVLTHAAWVSTTHMMSIVPALTVADLIEAGGAAFSGVTALLIVLRQDRAKVVA